MPGERWRDGGVDEIPLPVTNGRLWLCGKHFVGPDPEGAMASVGADLVVCLSEPHEIADRYPSYVDWLQANAPGRALWHPIPDLHAPDAAGADALLDSLHAQLAEGRSLLVHCGAGIGRAGTVAAALLVTSGVPLADALTAVRAHRPMAGPEAGAQTELLEALDARRVARATGA